ncbi:hypothetical protein F2P81_006643 [Scophthalmus maximus]|uniref:Uncharacterized protein n=1 Tax=Scophthalmus maximus TaxID=52904 RepID=A0A6A4T6G5_SCOMX|nr:hypothetical protein F2P81_006643 [Scophthalmus maximus]
MEEDFQESAVNYDHRCSDAEVTNEVQELDRVFQDQQNHQNPEGPHSDPDQVQHQVKDQTPADPPEVQVEDQVEDQVGDQVENQVKVQVEDQLKVQGEDQLKVQGEDQLKVQGEDQLKVQGEDQLKVQGEDQLKVQGEDQLKVQGEDQLKVQGEDQLKVQGEDQLKVQGEDQLKVQGEDQLKVQGEDQLKVQGEDQLKVQGEDQLKVQGEDQLKVQGEDQLKVQGEDQLKVQGEDQLKVQGEDQLKVQGEDQLKVQGEDQLKVQGEDQLKVQGEDQLKVQGEDQLKVQGEDQLKVQGEDQLKVQGEDQLKVQGEDQVEGQVGDQVENQVENQVEEQVEDQGAPDVHDGPELGGGGGVAESDLSPVHPHQDQDQDQDQTPAAAADQDGSGESGGGVPALVVTQAESPAAPQVGPGEPPDPDGGDMSCSDLLSLRSDSRRSEDDDTRSVTTSSVMSLFPRQQLDPLEKAWWRSSALGLIVAQRQLLAQEPALVLKKDFITVSISWWISREKLNKLIFTKQQKFKFYQFPSSLSVPGRHLHQDSNFFPPPLSPPPLLSPPPHADNLWDVNHPVHEGDCTPLGSEAGPSGSGGHDASLRSRRQRQIAIEQLKLFHQNTDVYWTERDSSVSYSPHPRLSKGDAKTSVRDYHGKTAPHYWSGGSDVFAREDSQSGARLSRGRRTQRYVLPSLLLTRSRSHGQLHLEFVTAPQSTSHDVLNLHV